MQPVRRALISVSDKTGVVDFAQILAAAGIQILSTGGTAKLLAEAGITLTEVSSHTGFPEIMGGRIKTLHPLIHGGLLGRRGTDDAVMAKHGIAPIDLLVVNLYPFEEAIAQPDCSLENAIENIDIGGPAMLRAAAKNFRNVGVVTHPEQYVLVTKELENNNGCLGDKLRFDLSVAAFNHVSNYDAAISDYMSCLNQDGTRREFPDQANARYVKLMDLRYGENPHQRAAFYRDLYPALGSLVSFKQLQGKELSFNNIYDADAAWECVRQFAGTACVIVKHANPCGVALADDCKAAYRLAYETDATSAFGGVIAFNREVDGATATHILQQQFVEVIVAPGFNSAAREILADKPNIRALEIPPGDNTPQHDIKRVTSGLLIQTADDISVDDIALEVVSKQTPTAEQLADLRFAWQVAKFVKSNAIVYAKNGRTLGIGAGQMSRVDSARIAVLKAFDANLSLQGAVMASDAFFPFRDSIDRAAEAGISAVIHPGGSVRDEEVIAAANDHNMVMLFTGIRHFKH